MDSRINTIYLTEYEQPEPILFYPYVKGDALTVDVHIQYIDFSLDNHTFTFSADSNPEIIMSPQTHTVDFSLDNMKPNQSNAGDISFFIKFQPYEIGNQNSLNIHVKIDDKEEQTLSLFITRENHNG